MQLTAERNSAVEVQEFLVKTKESMRQISGRKGRSLDQLYSLSEGLETSTYLLTSKRMNDVYDIDAHLRDLNEQLEVGDHLIGCANHMAGYETKVFVKGILLPKIGLRQLAFLIHRVLPKMSWGARAYRLITNGKGKRISKTEVLGRLAYAGFTIEKVNTDGVMLYYRVKKTSMPLQGYSPTYGPFIKLKRMVKNGKMVSIYKFRTMYPYSEFIQKYIYDQNDLEVGGKIKNDYRISEEGHLFRKFFLDELPMLINLFKGDVKLVGVRPLSEHYFSLYTEEMQKRRRRIKPGLLPPYYSEKKKPANLEEIMISEMRYILQHEKNPFTTDLKYFFRIAKNILWNKLRSK